eukprot:CAMPEP_0119106218 /NCGR_PEP_ID=MMETSP1180-20130426/3972_1 /TAXON_ID=3052 ORGANISM="Chlamydomonas cf sp, Strain CCMP681" /NCGR_SAMPLE_ID=MMETSP1180 /ASSEMBLY_ACC=CAM_ASM_000741 /LENGTH=74 /DNA_ID=CAMNT_0007091493 /DNA_START=15 /DNA_END=239 /DNA_ORIENTATION=+
MIHRPMTVQDDDANKVVEVVDAFDVLYRPAVDEEDRLKILCVVKVMHVTDGPDLVIVLHWHCHMHNVLALENAL